MEQCLRRSIGSILAQTFRDFELLLVDDGSTDGSGAICDEYASRDNRVKVIHQPNGGVGSARQRGIDCAKGIYVTHVDPDDWIDPEAYEDMVAAAERENADMLFCDFYYERRSGRKYQSQLPQWMNTLDILDDMFHFQLVASCWNRLVRMDTVKKYGVHFERGMNHWEDLYFNGALLKSDIRVAYLPHAYYHYNLEGSQTSLTKIATGRYKMFLDDIPVFQKAFADVVPAKQIRDFFLRQALSHAFGSGDFARESCRQDFRKYALVVLFSTTCHHNLRYFLSMMGCYKAVAAFRNKKKSLFRRTGD